jgi:transcriptional regulator
VYIPNHFAMSDQDVQDLLVHHGAGELVTYSPDSGLVATLLPFVYDRESGPLGALHGHLARNNDQWRHDVVGEALVLLRGPDAYVTPTWYASKREHGRVVPTWNYVTAHIYGTLRVRDDVDYVRWVVERLTEKHEAGSEHPWSIDDAPSRYVRGQLRAVVGVELQITRVEAKAKASQNRPAADVEGVVRGLRKRGEVAMADEVETRAATRRMMEP